MKISLPKTLPTQLNNPKKPLTNKYDFNKQPQVCVPVNLPIHEKIIKMELKEVFNDFIS